MRSLEIRAIPLLTMAYTDSTVYSLWCVQVSKQPAPDARQPPASVASVENKRADEKRRAPTAPSAYTKQTATASAGSFGAPATSLGPPGMVGTGATGGATEKLGAAGTSLAPATKGSDVPHTQASASVPAPGRGKARKAPSMFDNDDEEEDDLFSALQRVQGGAPASHAPLLPPACIHLSPFDYAFCTLRACCSIQLTFSLIFITRKLKLLKYLFSEIGIISLKLGIREILYP